MNVSMDMPNSHRNTFSMTCTISMEIFFLQWPVSPWRNCFHGDCFHGDSFHGCSFHGVTCQLHPTFFCDKALPYEISTAL